MLSTPNIPFIGVRISWLILAKNLLLASDERVALIALRNACLLDCSATRIAPANLIWRTQKSPIPNTARTANKLPDSNG